MTNPTLRPGDIGDGVRALQSALNTALAIDPPLTVDGHFGPTTMEAVYAFQSSSVGPDGRPLTVDGVAGSVTWWALLTEDQSGAFIDRPRVRMGVARCGLGKKVAMVAAGELAHRAREIGENNAGEWVEKYLAPLGLVSAPWCSGFASWCVQRAAEVEGVPMPFEYSGAARGILRQLEQVETPMCGDFAFWWRVSPNSWQGHVEIVTDYQDGVVWTIGGNRGSFPAPVRQFSYVVEREKRMLGFARLCA